MDFNLDSYNFHNKLYKILLCLSVLLYIIVLLGFVVKKGNIYIDYLHYFMHVYFSLYLIYRFNPFRKVKIHDLDYKIIFSSGIFLLLSSHVNLFLQPFLEKFKNFYGASDVYDIMEIVNVV